MTSKSVNKKQELTTIKCFLYYHTLKIYGHRVLVYGGIVIELGHWGVIRYYFGVSGTIHVIRRDILGQILDL